MGPDAERVFARGEAGEDGALFRRAHGARELGDADAKGLQEARERGVVLLGQDLRRRHEGRLRARLRRVPDAGRSHERLAAADVALYQAVHELAGAHVADRLAHGPQLRARGRDGQGAGEGPESGAAQDPALRALASAAQEPQRAGQHEELLEHQPPPRQAQRLHVRGEVDVLIGIARRAELVFVRDAVRQPVRQPALGQVQRLAHGGAHRVLRKPGGEAVDRNYPPSLSNTGFVIETKRPFTCARP